MHLKSIYIIFPKSRITKRDDLENALNQSFTNKHASSGVEFKALNHAQFFLPDETLTVAVQTNMFVTLINLFAARADRESAGRSSQRSVRPI